MFCSGCGTRLEPGAAFCGECGQAQPGASAAGGGPAAGFGLGGGDAGKAWLIGGLVIVAGLGAAFLLASGGGLSSLGRDEPAEAMERYISAMQDSRFDEALQLMDPQHTGPITALPAEKRAMAWAKARDQIFTKYCGSAGVASFDAETVEQIGDRAQVVTTFQCHDGTSNSDEGEPTFMRQSAGQWLVTK